MRFGGWNVQSGFLDPATGAYTALPVAAIPASFNFAKRDQGATVLLPPAQDQRIMVMGGGGPSISDVHIIDTDQANPAYVAAPSMLRPRIHVNAVLLPDRTVVATGGSAMSENAATASLEAEIFNPASNTWTTGATARVPRMYHSVALLLPDGRVLGAGSNPRRRDDELRLELYHPPYLLRGPRPCIDHAPAPSPPRPVRQDPHRERGRHQVDQPGPAHGHQPLLRQRAAPGRHPLWPPRPLQAHCPDARLGDGPTGVVIGPDGHAYVAELGARAVIRVDQTSGAETVISQAGHFVSPSGIALASGGHLLVVDHGADKVIDVDPVSGAQQVLSSGDELEAPVDIAVEQDGQILVVDLVGTS